MAISKVMEANFLQSYVCNGQLLVRRCADCARGLVAQPILIGGGPKKGVRI
jgi:hypothetical protein